MNTLMCRPVKPSSDSCMSDPTPPLSRILMPDVCRSASPRLAVLFCMARVSMPAALNAELTTRCDMLWLTVTSSICSLLGTSRTCSSWDVPLPSITTSCSAVANPKHDTTSV